MQEMGLINKIAITHGGKRVSEFIWDKGYTLEKIIVVSNNMKTTCYEKATGKKLFFLTDVDYLVFDGGVIFTKDGKKGACNTDGKMILDIEYDQIVFKSNCVLVEKNNKKGVFDYEGNEIIPIMYSNINILENFIEVIFGDKCGLYDYKGKVIVPSVYRYIKIYKNGIIVCNQNMKEGFYAYNGKILIKEIYDDVSVYEYGILVRINNTYGVFDFEGNEILPFEFNDVNYISDKKLFVVLRENHKGVYSLKGKELLPIKYTKIIFYNYGIQAYIGGRVGLFSYNYDMLLPAEYSKIELCDFNRLSLLKDDKYSLYELDKCKIIE